MKQLTILLVGVLISGCSHSFSADEKEARKQLLELAPLGSDARDALPKLQAMGFKCLWSKQARFVGIEGKNDYLYCDNRQMVGPLIHRRWQLALVHSAYVVSNAKFGIALTGP